MKLDEDIAVADLGDLGLLVVGEAIEVLAVGLDGPGSCGGWSRHVEGFVVNV